jgi:hypothetical protein
MRTRFLAKMGMVVRLAVARKNRVSRLGVHAKRTRTRFLEKMGMAVRLAVARKNRVSHLGVRAKRTRLRFLAKMGMAVRLAVAKNSTWNFHPLTKAKRARISASSRKMVRTALGNLSSSGRGLQVAHLMVVEQTRRHTTKCGLSSHMPSLVDRLPIHHLVSLMSRRVVKLAGLSAKNSR